METVKELVDIGILVILGGMGFIALAYIMERMLYLKKVKQHFAAYTSQDAFDNDVTRNLTTLYIIYSNAPYVGLLGTVIGIMITFYDMGQASSINTSAIMTGLSLALYATALGLVVAIPTLIAYNGLNRKIAVLSSDFKEHLASRELNGFNLAAPHMHTAAEGSDKGVNETEPAA